MESYKNLLRTILERGEPRTDRTGTGTIEIPYYVFEHDMTDGFPLMTTKKMGIKTVIHELLWFISGSTNIKYLVDNNVNIWNDNAYPFYEKFCDSNGMYKLSQETFIKAIKAGETMKTLAKTHNSEHLFHADEYGYELGDLGPVYGAQWRSWDSTLVLRGTPGSEEEIGLGWIRTNVLPAKIDQLADAINKIKNNPTDRRIRVSAWNVAELSDMALPPCHHSFSFYVHNDDTLDLHFQQRSCDTFLGIPFNIASYAALLLMVARVTNKIPGKLVGFLENVHIYNDHIEQVKLQLEREPLPLPTLAVRPGITSIDSFKIEDFQLSGYESHSAIKGKMSV